MSSTSSKRTQRANPVQAGPAQAASEQPEPLDTHYLEGLIGYNARRAALTVIGVFLERMAPYGLRPVEFSPVPDSSQPWRHRPPTLPQPGPAAVQYGGHHQCL